MDQLPALGTAIGQIVGPTFQVYTPLLAKQTDRIKSTKCNTYVYGPHSRQKFDLYTPSASSKLAVANENSVLVFLYGGGFIRGDKALNDLVYANLGHYFAENLGIKVVVVDYRLLSHGAQFPSGGEDIALALDQISQQFITQSSSPLDIYLMGNSAGGVHVATYLLSHETSVSRRQVLPNARGNMILKAAILLSVPLHFQQAHPSRAQDLSTYFGPDLDGRCPLGLLKTSKENGIFEEVKQIPILVLKGSLDPQDEILTPNYDFVKAWFDLTGPSSNLIAQTMEGHNHISPVLAVGTGVLAEEAWGRQVVDFIVTSSQN